MLPNRRGKSGVLCLLAIIVLCCSSIALANTKDERTEEHVTKPQTTHAKDHTSLFPLNSRDIWLLIGVTFTSFLAANAGIGGGGILLPLLVFVASFTPRLAAALSNVCILGGSLANFILNFQRRHPVYNFLPLIDYDLILMLEPPTVLGALLGGFANKLLGTWVTSSLMAIILSLVAIQLVKRALAASTPKSFAERRHPHPQHGLSGSVLAAITTGQHTDTAQNSAQAAAISHPAHIWATQGPAQNAEAQISEAPHPAGDDALQGTAGAAEQQQQQPHAHSMHTQPHATQHTQHGHDGVPQAPAPMEAITEEASVHHGCARGASNDEGLKQLEQGPPQYELTVEDDGPEQKARKFQKHRPLEEAQPTHQLQPAQQAAYKLAYQLRIEGHVDDLMVEQVQQDKLLEQTPQRDQQAQIQININGHPAHGQRASHRPPWNQLMWLGWLSVWVAFSQLVANRWVECGSSSYWLAVLSVVPVALIVLLLTRRRVLKEHRRSSLLPRTQSRHQGWTVIGEELTMPLLHHGGTSETEQSEGHQHQPAHQQQIKLQAQHIAWQEPSHHQILQAPHAYASSMRMNTANPHPLPPSPFGAQPAQPTAHPSIVALPVQPEIAWTPKTTLLYPTLCSAAGVVAGVCGVGGGIIKGPLMLHLGVRPEVATASSATMILATSLSATTVYAGLGAFSTTMDYAVAMSVLGFVATAIGQTVLHVYTKRKPRTGNREEQQRQKSSIIIKIMATIMVISACTMGYAAILEVLNVVHNPSLLTEFGRLCPEKKEPQHGGLSDLEQGCQALEHASIFLTV